jgi:hypothetical protein
MEQGGRVKLELDALESEALIFHIIKAASKQDSKYFRLFVIRAILIFLCIDIADWIEVNVWELSPGCLQLTLG